MAAKDYSFQSGAFGTVYLAKNNKSKSLMSSDRRAITENELLGLFEHYVLNKCEKDKCKTFGVTNGDGEEIFEVKLSQQEVDKLISKIKKATE